MSFSTAELLGVNGPLFVILGVFLALRRELKKDIDKRIREAKEDTEDFSSEVADYDRASAAWENFRLGTGQLRALQARLEYLLLAEIILFVFGFLVLLLASQYTALPIGIVITLVFSLLMLLPILGLYRVRSRFQPIAP